jgi:prepilin-type N-terminal cleavage/methylation domain-containing protein
MIAKKGFTLVELMVAVVVTAVGMVGVLSALNQCAVVMATSERQITANYLLNQKMWETQEMSRTGELALGKASGIFEAPYGDFNWTRTISEFPESFGNESETLKKYLVEENVTIGWQRRGTDRGLTVVAYAPKP